MKSRPPRVGDSIWLECEVKPGPFSDERLVRVPPEVGEWLGFVSVSSLKDPTVETGKTFVMARIVQVSGGEFAAQIVGHAISPKPIHGQVSQLLREPVAVPA